MKILVFMKNWLGDVLFQLPVIQTLRENYPDAKIVALAPARCQEILKAVPFLDGVRVFDERQSERSLFSKIKFVAWLRQEKFNQAFLFHRSFTRALLCRLGGIGKRIGFETSKRKRMLTTSVPLPKKPVHQVDYFLVLLKWAGLRVKFGREYQFYYSAEDDARARHLMETAGLKEKSFAAFHIGANWKPKKWPAEYFLRLAKQVTENFSRPVVLTGGNEEQAAAEQMVGRAKNGRLISFCGKTSLGVLGALYQKAAFVVSSDSGPLHIASGVGTPVVALFGPTSPELTGPRGVGKKIVIHFVLEGYETPWFGKESEFPYEGWMEKITPGQVFETIGRENLWTNHTEKISSSSH